MSIVNHHCMFLDMKQVGPNQAEHALNSQSNMLPSFLCALHWSFQSELSRLSRSHTSKLLFGTLRLEGLLLQVLTRHNDDSYGTSDTTGKNPFPSGCDIKKSGVACAGCRMQSPPTSVLPPTWSDGFGPSVFAADAVPVPPGRSPGANERGAVECAARAVPSWKWLGVRHRCVRD